MCIFAILVGVFAYLAYIKQSVPIEPIFWGTFIFGVIGAVAIPFIAIKINKNINKTFEAEKKTPEPEINITSFPTTISLVKKVRPNERIVRQKWCLEWSLMLYRAGVLPFGLNLPNILPLPEILVETDEAFYIDRRLTFLSGLVTSGLILVLAYIFAHDWLVTLLPFLKDPNFIPVLSPFFVIMLIFVVIVNVFWQKGNIEVVKKSWLSNSDTKGRVLRLNGTVPANAITILSNQPFYENTGISSYFKRIFFLL